MSDRPEPIVTGIQVVGIYATDLERARRFYVDLLGLHVKEEMEPGVLLSAGETTIYLEGGRSLAVDPGLFAASTSICFGSKSIRSAYERLTAAGAHVVEPYTEFSPTFAMFQIADPDGLVVEFAGIP
jgi:predicted enzyme related to lactoylglutathione lyase